ncbi:dienelactone hydrolase family protein [Arcticibacterium luteifluviistationis]|uniref:Dienelactone hydrolase n=1 Tax=Arcticibacterium luteifluviistationis TaxID=1784714 RepID=A0A2Z4GD50_9BACT|nr:dienelactone hydrolase family protein [Arcticibacterium luteifluviistationis]AWV99074.1 dienelactone hydrolase [Arcticibacterium luteifluviistationis]
MKKLRKEDIKQEVFDLYDDYAHDRLDRSGFMKQLAVYAVGSVTVASLMSFLMPDYKGQVQIKKDDPRIKSTFISYNSPKGGGEIKALLSMPADAKKVLGGVVVVHENRGLNPYIEDVGRRAALAGFISIAPDALTPLGGYPGTDDEGRTLQKQRDRNEMLEDFMAAADYLKAHKKCNGKIGVVGFCFGGWVANMMAVKVPYLAASVPFYGGQPDKEDVVNINAPLLLHYGGLDTRVNAGWPDYEVALKKNNKGYSAYVYQGANHGFHNDTTPRFDKPSADLAWKRTVDFFKDKLS